MGVRDRAILTAGETSPVQRGGIIGESESFNRLFNEFSSVLFMAACVSLVCC